MRSFFRLVLLALVLLVVALVSALTAMRFAIHGSEVAVPNLVERTPADARRIAQEHGFEMVVERQYYSASIPQGKILSQLPPAGTKLRPGWQIRVAQSLGPQRVEIPSLLGQSERAAEMNMRRRGLDMGAIAEMPAAGTSSGQVLSQSPPPDASGISAPKISLLVADPAQPHAFVMPSFIGQPLGSVKLALQDAGLHLGTVTMPAPPASPYSPPIAPASQPSSASIISTQYPAPGEKVWAGSAVNFGVQ